MPTGRVIEQSTARNSIGRVLTRRCTEQLLGFVRSLPPGPVLDLGCGEGGRTAAIARTFPTRQVVGLNLSTDRQKATTRRDYPPNLTFCEGTAEALPFQTGEFDVVTAIEILDHLEDPETALTEIRRVCRGFLVATVPRDPVWKMLKALPGVGVRQAEDTSDKAHHWSKRRFLRLMKEHGHVAASAAPIPWTIVLVELH